MIEETLQSREAPNGSFADNAEVTQTLKSVIKKYNTSALTFVQKEALDRICIKIGRIITGNPNEPDHWHDIAGYATLAEKEISKNG